MNSFKINRNSWHYKLNHNLCTMNIDCWEEEHSSICSYFWATMINTLKILLVLTAIPIIAAMIMMIIIASPAAAGIGSGVVASALFLPVIVIMIYDYVFERIRISHAKNPSIIVQRIADYKNRVCTRVEFTE